MINSNKTTIENYKGISVKEEVALPSNSPAREEAQND